MYLVQSKSFIHLRNNMDPKYVTQNSYIRFIQIYYSNEVLIPDEKARTNLG